MTSVSPRARRPARPKSRAKTGLRWLYLMHRWIGIATCVLCATWFVSGLVMVYVPYPSLSDRDRMTYSEPLSLERVAITPDQALAAAGLAAFPSQFRLTTLRGEPVYRITDGKRRLVVSAVDGRRLGATSAAQAADAVRRLLPGHELGPVRTLVRDQWTVAQGFDPHRPLYRVPVRDARGLTLYVSSRTGEVVQETTRRERLWNWLGSIPHWIYLTVIRQDNEVWRQVILWTSGPALVGALAGAWIGLLRMRAKAGHALSPYRGWMKWHHLSGLIAGLFTITWIFSGWLSVNPFHWFPRRPTSDTALARYAGHTAATFPATLATLRQVPLNGAHDARFAWVQGRPLVILADPDLAPATLDARNGAPAILTDETLFANARALVPGAPIAFARRLTHQDAYWYSTRRNPRPLPVLRIGFSDRNATWVHIDPVTGDVLGQTDRNRRLYRWLFDALHAWELPVFTQADTARQLLIWALSAGGLALSASGVVVGWRRLRLTLRPRRRQEPSPEIPHG